MIALITLLSLLSTLGAFLGVGVSLALIWVLPLTFIGAFLGWVLVAFLFLWLSCVFAPMDKPREQESKFYRHLVEWYVDAVVTLVGVKFDTSGLENIPKDGRFLLPLSPKKKMPPCSWLAS